MASDVNNFSENIGHYIVFGKTGSGKTTLMNAILEQSVTRILIGDTFELKFTQNKGKGKRRGKK